MPRSLRNALLHDRREQHFRRAPWRKQRRRPQGARRTTETREENERISIHHRDEEQQRARHCALGLNAYTHTETETHGLLFWRERGARESQNTFHCSSVRIISDGTLHWKDKGAWHNVREAKKSESLRAIFFPPPCSPTRSFCLDICPREYVPWILGTHLSFFLFLFSSFYFYHLLIPSFFLPVLTDFSSFFFVMTAT